MKSLRVQLFFVFAILLQAPLLTAAHADYTWDDALKLFDPQNAPPAVTENGLGDWQQCLVKDEGYQPVAADANGQLLPACRPDTLYTWGPYLKLYDFLKEAPGHSAPWAPRFVDMIYAHINPLATFGYGELSIRMKLKKTTQFLLYTADKISTSNNAYCTQLLTPAQVENTVVVRYWNHSDLQGTDYIICSPNTIESWSYGTKQHYDELVASQLWNNALPNGSDKWISYTVNSDGNMLYGTGLDQMNWSTDTALQDFKGMQDAASEDIGQIYYAPGVTANPNEHFLSNHKVYWHWK